MSNETIVSFDAVSFEYEHDHSLLDEASFSVRQGSKITIMGQNGAGKSTILNMISGKFKAKHGSVNVIPSLTIAMAHQVMRPEDRGLTVRAFFEGCFKEKVYNIDPKIDAALEIVNLHAPHDRIVSSFSGGQQARLLLASALIREPDLLMLDEPTNNLDPAGIEHLMGFILGYDKTCLVISHDADFLNTFTDGVLYLDVHTRKVEQYVGNYFDVVEEIAARIEKENMKNAQLAKEIQENKDKANVFAHKGGKLRLVAKRMREKVEEYEENKVEVRREDKTIRPFTIPMQDDVIGEILRITSVSVIRDHKSSTRKVNVSLKRNQHLLLTGPNGIGKTTLLESIANGTAKGMTMAKDIILGYYRQDFSTLNFEETVYQSLVNAFKSYTSPEKSFEEYIRSVASSFLITKHEIFRKIGSLSEGQKGLVSFARLVLQKPGLLILDEPTNHINFRHIPVISEALDAYEGAMILVSHVPEFVAKIRIDETLDLGK
ncbi:ABC-F family ATP-binding cassette domain-containing protein [Candidatus Peregrinibacteria bacterium]|nr:ABC-F family ATP-binding cassette domain-containing protein [Candidatus Peregrinibacteria bacterium]